MSGLDKAAAAFDTELGLERGEPLINRADKDDGPETLSMDDIFPNLNNHEDDVVAGGDGDGQQSFDRRATREVEGRDDNDPEVDDDLDVDGYDDRRRSRDGDEDVQETEDIDEDEDNEDPDNDDEDQYEVTVDGKPQVVTLSEALAGYIRQETFHQRLNRLNEAEKEIMTFAGTLIEARNKYVDLIEQMEESFKTLLPAEPDWDQQYRENPIKARELEKNYKAAQAKLDDLKAKREQAKKENAEQMLQQQLRWQRGENAKLPAVFPKWFDKTKDRDGNEIGKKNMDREVAAMKATALAAGFSNEEIESTFDVRMLLVLNKAAGYDRIMERRTPTPIKRGSKPVAHGVGRVATRTAPNGVARKMKQLEKTGSVRDAALVFDDIIKNQRSTRRNR